MVGCRLAEAVEAPVTSSLLCPEGCQLKDTFDALFIEYSTEQLPEQRFIALIKCWFKSASIRLCSRQERKGIVGSGMSCLRQTQFFQGIGNNDCLFAIRDIDSSRSHIPCMLIALEISRVIADSTRSNQFPCIELLLCRKYRWSHLPWGGVERALLLDPASETLSVQ